MGDIMGEHSEDWHIVDRQWSERYRNDVNRYEQRITQIEQEAQGMRQVLIALKTQLRADGRDKWRDAINSITRVLELESTEERA